jgi:hypothetical protein
LIGRLPLGVLPLAILGLAYALIRRCGRPPGEAAVFAALLWAYGIALACEVLSLFQVLTFASLLTLWFLTLAAVILALARSRPPPRPRLRSLGEAAAGLIFEEWILVVAVLVIGSVTLLVALVAPPGTADSQTYHLPRIEHWIQNRSLAFYPTPVGRQLVMPNLAELLILQLRLLSGGDRLDNLVQWMAGAGSIFLVGRVTTALGASRRGVAFARLVAATLPIGILETTSTQNDLVTAFFILAMAERLLAWRHCRSPIDAAAFAAAAGLALATKGTAYLIGLPLGLWFLVASLRAGPRALAMLALCSVVLLLPNLPGYLRNIDYSGAPLSGGDVTNNADFGLDALTVNGVRNLASNLATGSIALNRQITQIVYTWLGILGLDTNAPQLTFAGTSFGLTADQGNENTAANPAQLLLALASLVVVLRSSGVSPHPRRIYALCLLAAGLLFVTVLRWQPWITRLQLPLFALAAPLAAFLPIGGAPSGRTRARERTLSAAFATSLLFFAWRPLWENSHRPLLPSSARRDGILASSADELLFIANPGLRSSYEAATRYVAAQGDRRIGLLIGGDDWEYPIWRLLREVGTRDLRIEHLSDASPGSARPYPLGPFDPTLVITTLVDLPARLTINGKPWLRVQQYPALSIYRRKPP